MDKMEHPVNIIGAGAVGKALAVLLQNEGREVRLIRGRSDQSAGAKEQVILQLIGGPEITQTLQVTTLDQHTVLEGTIVITTKSFGNAVLAARLSKKEINGNMVLLQNGLGIEQPFINHAFQSVMRCVLFCTGQVTTENTVRFKHVRPSPIGIVQGREEQLAATVANLHTSSFPFTQEKDIQPVIWKKAIINSVFNSICPLLETDNGIFYREKEVLQIGKEVIREGIAVAQLKGISLNEDDIVEQLLQISRTSDGQFISTLQDIMAKRPTEIETLNLAIADMGQGLGKNGIVQRNALLGKLIWWKSKLHS
jgi:2-dehydropantoate 2-reductase